MTPMPIFSICPIAHVYPKTESVEAESVAEAIRITNMKWERRILDSVEGVRTYEVQADSDDMRAYAIRKR